MKRTIGVLATRHIWVGAVEDHDLKESIVYPSPGEGAWDMRSMPGERIAETIRSVVARLTGERPAEAVGLAFPGIICDGIVQECPNYPQMKGFQLAAALTSGVPVRVMNDTDAMAAGIAATSGQLEKLVRAWYLGDGIGFGRYPDSEAIWEMGHSVVSLDPKERYCGCGGVGHLESIMGHGSIRRRFLDLEPEEVFAKAREGDERCVEFLSLWHRALAAASASSIHIDGPGKFYVLGPNAEFVQPQLLDRYIHELVKMSSLQSSVFEVAEGSHRMAIIGAAVQANIAANTPAPR